jgi:MoxR-like ATPase
MSENYEFRYSGAEQYQPQSQIEDPDKRKYFPYLPSDSLVKAVNLSIALERPLLLEGDPGCGKTRLASAIAYEFTLKYREQQTDTDASNRWWPYYVWNVKSTTRARDGLYSFDAVGRLRDAQLMGVTPQLQDSVLTSAEIKTLKNRVQFSQTYREFKALGKALRPDPERLWTHELRPIVLIDEIDKADSDFPNDLLIELEEYRFEIPETGEEVVVGENQPKPIILITSNRERPLPDAFLRRCLYYRVRFPEAEGLARIIQRRFGRLSADKTKLVAQATERFYEIRGLLENPPQTRPPGTSEFIDFITALLQYPDLKQAKADLEDLSNQIHLLGTLVKNESDQARIVE